MLSRDLVNELVKLEERPWCEWRKGNPLTQNGLAKILRTFAIHSKDIRTGIVGRGFNLEQFEDVFKRYIPKPPIQSATVLQATDNKAHRGFQSATDSASAALRNTLQTTHNKECSTVALQNATFREEATK